jgi:hypothetical protein
MLFIKIAIYLLLNIHKGRLNDRRRLHPSKENIQHFKVQSLTRGEADLFIGRGHERL